MIYFEKIATRYGVVEVKKEAEDNCIGITLNFGIEKECVFHWGLSRAPEGAWVLPPEGIRPENTLVYDEHAARTPVSPSKSIHIRIPGEDYTGLLFVLHFPGENEWDNNHGKDYRIRLGEFRSKKGSGVMDHDLDDVAAEIIEKETGGNSWTLMHRYNLCHELLDRVGESRAGLALLFVWLRFSAMRQLDWQRNYNTQPRELSHAQQRLTRRLTRLYREQPGQREIARFMLTTMGHGGEGQRIRDEILEIMHRHHIREVSEIFMEQWHQKMHNNTTPDDIVICEAYLEFLRSGGDTDTFYTALERGGVTRERLESFERPINARPDFYPDRKDAMIHDFEHFLGTLKSVHSAADLGVCIHASRPYFDDGSHRLADFIWDHRDAANADVNSLFGKVTELRRRIMENIGSDEADPELLCLDIALEDFLRTATERNMHIEMTPGTLSGRLTLIMRNFLLVREEQDLSLSLLQWDNIRKSCPLEPDLMLQADSVLDRIERTVGDYVFVYQKLFQPPAELLGEAFRADSWAIGLFSEDVMRGSPVFAVSVLCQRLRRLLREKGKLSSWQPVSRGGGSGKVRVMENLDPIQGKRFDPPVIIVSDRIRGDEDLPEGAVAVISSGSVDVVSHVAIRARNQGVLLATCYDPEIYEELRSLEGRFMKLEIDASGEVRFEPAGEPGEETGREHGHMQPVDMDFHEPPDAPYAVTEEGFEQGLVGGKSLHLKELRKRLPGWIRLPVSIALPFGTFEKVLEAQVNRKARERYDRLLMRVGKEPDVLHELRETVMDLTEPGDLHADLLKVPEKGGLDLTENHDKAWECIKAVWASKWNDRAYWNRKARGIPHEKLLMGVLIQELVNAEYAYIIHTVHPFSGNRDELYAEVVPGLGETLAGNYPGRALSFSMSKKSGEISLHTYPSKSIGLYGAGLIFRSDSNGEDLAGYAGAGLYSSFPIQPPEEVHLDYTRDRLVQDREFRDRFLAGIGRAGMIVEDATGMPQDIEGAFAAGQYYVVQTRNQVGIEL